MINLRCWYCGCLPTPTKTLCTEHQQPKTRGGTDDASNLVRSCRSCNNRKGTYTLDEYRQLNGPFYGEGAPLKVDANQPDPILPTDPQLRARMLLDYINLVSLSRLLDVGRSTILAFATGAIASGDVKVRKYVYRHIVNSLNALDYADPFIVELK